MSALYESYKTIEENRNFTVYKHTSPNGKVYIGITSQKPEYRWDNGNGYRNQRLFYRAIQKYGWKNITHEILFNNLTEEEAKLTEQLYIALYDSFNVKYGYNQTLGGDGALGNKNRLGKYHTEETKKKISKTKKGVKLGHFNLTEEQRKYKSELCKKQNLFQYHTEETEKKRILNSTKANKERGCPQWQRDAISLKNRGSKNGQSKLTEEDVIKIKKLIKQGYSNAWIANKFNVSSGTITGIKYGRRWSYLLDEEDKVLIDKIKEKKFPNSKKVICITTNKIFDSIKEAGQFYDIKSWRNISTVCKNKKACGKLPNGTLLKWMYYDDYLKAKEV